MGQLKIVDTWQEEINGHKLYYIIFNDGKTYNTCISKAVYSNGTTHYAMSDERNPFNFYGTQKELKKLWETLLTN